MRDSCETAVCAAWLAPLQHACTVVYDMHICLLQTYTIKLSEADESLIVPYRRALGCALKHGNSTVHQDSA